MTRFLSSVLVAGVLTAAVPVAAFAHEDHDRDHRRQCTTVRKCHWSHGHKICFKKRVCEDRGHDNH